MELTIAQLAEHTGVAAGTLRMWESRYDFPRPARLPSGHRRYRERDIELVEQVLRRRDDGLSLAAAIERVRRQGDRLPASIFAALRERRPDLRPVVVRKPALLALTRAIEDERCASAAGGLVVGSFQREHHYRSTERRWREVTRTAQSAVALADFGAVRNRPGEPAEIPIEPTAPLAREWSLVSESDACRGCVAGWEVPDDTDPPDRERRFEIVFSSEPEVVRVAMDVAIELVRSASPELADSMQAALGDAVRPSVPEIRAASALTQRMIGYLAAAGTTAGAHAAA
jgi:DICT domain-containing protein